MLIKCSEVPIPVGMYGLFPKLYAGDIGVDNYKKRLSIKDVVDSPYTVPLSPVFVWSHIHVVRPIVDMIFFLKRRSIQPHTWRIPGAGQKGLILILPKKYPYRKSDTPIKYIFLKLWIFHEIKHGACHFTLHPADECLAATLVTSASSQQWLSQKR